MVRIHFRARDHDVEIQCPDGANLRMVLLHARIPLYTKVAQALHCRGRATCGTCAVQVEGSASEPTAAELRRLALPPFAKRKDMRLACQCTVLGDLEVVKRDGLFGQREEEESG
jgi:ferredoxin